jgi:hypothetical protein
MTDRSQEADSDPSWEDPLNLQLTPASVFTSLMHSADSVHTGWQSCIEDTLAQVSSTLVDEGTGNHCRIAELEYADQENPNESWHDWTVELKVGEVYLSAHWRERVGGSPADWSWCQAQAEEAFTRACVLIGKRVRRGFVSDTPIENLRTSRTRH